MKTVFGAVAKLRGGGRAVPIRRKCFTASFVHFMFLRMSAIEKPGWHNRGYLPHFDANCLLQHIVLSGKEGIDLTTPKLATIIEASLRHYDKLRYCLHAWCIMPDHVHVYLVFAPSQLLGSNVRQWKSIITKRWQTSVGTTQLVFMPDYFDRYSRTLNQSMRAINYIEYNPVAAGYVHEPTEWQWSSAFHKANGWLAGHEWLPLFLPSGSR